MDTATLARDTLAAIIRACEGKVSGTLSGRSDDQTAVSRTAALMRDRSCNTAFVWI